VDNGLEHRRAIYAASPLFLLQVRCLQMTMLWNVSRRANVQSFSAHLEHNKLNDDTVFRISLIGQTRSVDKGCQNMCQCQQATYDPYAYQDPMGCPYCGQNVYAVPYPSLTVSYDPYWPSRVTPSAHPLVSYPAVSTRRFRGEVRVGNCLLIYE
jgi:hypothetical protein